MRTVTSLTWALLASIGMTSSAWALGQMETQAGSTGSILARSHHVSVAIDNGFCRTETTQTFVNSAAWAVEATYSLPLPESASLSEVEIVRNGRVIRGEVVAKDRAREVYEEEKSRGEDAALAEKEGYRSWRFRVGSLPPGEDIRIRTVYYQPMILDTGVGRYLYPLEPASPDHRAPTVSPLAPAEVLTLHVELKTAWPIADVRVPGLEKEAKITKKTDGHFVIDLVKTRARTDRDLIVYYKLQDDLPGRVELAAYRKDADHPGTFMLVLTPGIDLEPLRGGSDFTFVLDISGSMDDKLPKLIAAVKRTLGQLDPKDRFRIVLFENAPIRLTGGFVLATADELERVIGQLELLRAQGGTDLYRGLEAGLEDLAPGRVNTVILVTDGIANQGLVDGQKFHALLKGTDVRFFGFLIGNETNWPLMRALCQASGGFYSTISNQDDLLGQIMLAKSKITHEVLHDAKVEITGVETFDITHDIVGKVHRGQQMVIFGKYLAGGPARLTLRARISGEDRLYTTTFDFPAIANDRPELERLWALTRIEGIQGQALIGRSTPDEAAASTRSLGIQYQLVTDETSMLVLSDRAFMAHGIARASRDRIGLENEARQRTAVAPAPVQRVDVPPPGSGRSSSGPMFPDPAPRRRSGGGALDPFSAIGLISLGVIGLSRRRDEEGRDEDPS